MGVKSGLFSKLYYCAFGLYFQNRIWVALVGLESFRPEFGFFLCFSVLKFHRDHSFEGCPVYERVGCNLIPSQGL